MAKPFRLQPVTPTETAVQSWSIDAIRRVPGVAAVLRVNGGLIRSGYPSYRLFLRGEPQPVSSGLSDLLVFYSGGAVLLLEIKRPGETITDNQQRVETWAKACKVPYSVVDNFDDARAVVWAYSPSNRGSREQN